MNEREEVYSKKISAGPKRTYFIDVKQQRNGSVYIQFSESYRKDEFGRSERSRIMIYKEDFKKVEDGFADVMKFIKDDLGISYF